MDVNALIDFACRIIKIPGQTSNESGISTLCADSMHSFGFDEVHVDSLCNTVGIMRGSGKGVIMFDGHIDTVSVTDDAAWSIAPYGGVVKDGRIYGRGASDMRGAVAAMIKAIGDEAATRREDMPTIVLSCTTHEEVAEGFCLKLTLKWLQQTQGIRPDMIVIGEASELHVNRGQRGRAAIYIDAHGVAAHSSNPRAGQNAISVMQPVLEAIKNRKVPHHDFLGDGSAAVTGIISRPWPALSVIPDLCTIAVDRRLLPGESRDDILSEFTALTDAVTRENIQNRYTVRYRQTVYSLPDGGQINRETYAPAWEVKEDHPAVQTGLRALEACGLPPVCGHYSFCTNGSGSCGELGIPTIGLGPSYEHLAHVVDEYIDIDQLVGAYAAYRALIREFARQ